ncbi:MAG: glucuronate isomerase [Chitinophagaceae bacterium]|nr:glucuronate isomerase [Chitinophagaceae bacterium]
MPKQFIDDNFLLETETAQRLYHVYAKDMPIFDYHNHLSADRLASNTSFRNLTEAWLQGDHYKWRAMRANGISEEYITGNASDAEKFTKWANTVPYTFRNPLFHWTHLELQRYFGIHEILNHESAASVYQAANEQLAEAACSPRSLLTRMKVVFVGTTDDPTDDLAAHQQLRNEGFSIQVAPTFRPDKAMAVDNTTSFLAYLNKLEACTNHHIVDFSTYVEALRSRHDFFSEQGCVASDHGIDQLYCHSFSDTSLQQSFEKLRNGNSLSQEEIASFKSAMLYFFAQWGNEKGWVQQYHIGPIRNGNTRMFLRMGPDTGWDAMGNPTDLRQVNQFLDRLDQTNQLAKTILYSIHPGDQHPLATLIGNFNDGTFPGKIQLGAAWWFNDQKEGILQHLQAISQMGLLSRFVGMLTDSRSFLSFPRHEYFRRILCNLLGQEIENGELPNDEKWIGEQIQNICYHNAVNYFKKTF